GAWPAPRAATTASATTIGRSMKSILYANRQSPIRQSTIRNRQSVNRHSPIANRQCKIPSVSVHVVEHPLVHDALVTLRDARTPPEEFRRMAVRISLLLAGEATRDLPASPVTVQTPLGPAEGRRVSADVVVV